MDSPSTSTSSTDLFGTTTNAMNFLQQFSQLIFLQSLAAAAAPGGEEGGKIASIFDFTKLQQQFSPSHSQTTMLPPISPEANDDTTKYLQTISDLLSSPQNLKSQYSPPTLPSEAATSPFKMYNNDFGLDSLYSTLATPATTRQYKVHVNRESAKPLQEWFNQHISDPYPNQKDVQQLAAQTGFTFKQIRNWFTNSRRRYESSCGTNPLPWTKKDAPKVARKLLSNESSSSEGCESS